jgi:hypothetical protein
VAQLKKNEIWTNAWMKLNIWCFIIVQYWHKGNDFLVVPLLQPVSDMYVLSYSIAMKRRCFYWYKLSWVETTSDVDCHILSIAQSMCGNTNGCHMTDIYRLNIYCKL